MKTTAGMARGSQTAGSPAITSTATLPSWAALWASIGSPATSPMAKMCSSVVPPLLVHLDEALVVELHPGLFQAEVARVGPAADGDQDASNVGSVRSTSSPSNVARMPSGVSAILATLVLR